MIKRDQLFPGPTASNFGFEIFTFFGVKIRALGAGLDLLIISVVKFWWFSFFFSSSLGPLELELASFKDWQEIGNIWEISLKVASAPDTLATLHHLR